MIASQFSGGAEGTSRPELSPPKGWSERTLFYRAHLADALVGVVLGAGVLVLKAGSILLSQVRDLNWRSPEFGGLWNKSRRLKTTIWWNLANALVGVILGACVIARVEPGLRGQGCTLWDMGGTVFMELGFGMRLPQGPAGGRRVVEARG